MREKTLIPPVPKEYISYSEEEKIEKTEQYYKKVSELYSRIEGFQEECKKKMNALLETQADTKDLLAILSEEKMRMLCHYTYDFALLKRMCRIAEVEEVFKEPCVMQNICNLKDVTEWYQRCLFLVRRFEFNWEEDCELLDFIQQGKISYICLSELICDNEIIQKIQTGCRIAEYLHKNNCQREAVLFIMGLEQKLPYSERKVMHFTMTLLDMGERQLAYEVLMKHQNPNADIREMQITLSKMV